MFVENPLQVKQCGVEDTDMNGTGSSPEGVHGAAGEQKQTKGHWEGKNTRQGVGGVVGREEGGELKRDFSQLRVLGQL